MNLWHFSFGAYNLDPTEGPHKDLINAENIWGNCTEIVGDARNLIGDVSRIHGDISGLSGDALNRKLYVTQGLYIGDVQGHIDRHHAEIN